MQRPEELFPWGMGAVTDAPYHGETKDYTQRSAGTRDSTPPEVPQAPEDVVVGFEVAQRVGFQYFEEIEEGVFLSKRANQMWDSE